MSELEEELNETKIACEKLQYEIATFCRAVKLLMQANNLLRRENNGGDLLDKNVAGNQKILVYEESIN